MTRPAPYTALDLAWVDSLAFALLHYRGVDDRTAEERLMDRLHAVLDGIGEELERGVADVCLAVARRLDGVFPSGQAGLEFRSMETGEVVDPEMFLADPDGQASVWAARVCAAALGRDVGMVESLVDHQVGLGAMPLLEGFRMLLLGASHIDHEAAHREEAAAQTAMRMTGVVPDYVLLCQAGGPSGEARLAPCVHRIVADRHWRDHAAAEHVLMTGHTVIMKEE